MVIVMALFTLQISIPVQGGFVTYREVIKGKFFIFNISILYVQSVWYDST